MQPIFFIILVGLLGGMAIGVQSPMSSMISQRLGVMESIFIVHVGGALAVSIPLLVFGSRLGEWRSVPWYTLGAGAFGLMVIFSMSYMIPRIGVAGALITLMAGQLFVGSLLDHFGWLGAAQRVMDVPRMIGLGVVMLGVWLTVK
ncbi:MAG TPA: DMT family transporter [Anaerolineales bacterium]|nr:DMT family transporter [Anaerolineales bacterium]